MTVIYFDILFIVNLFVNYFLLLSTAKFVHFMPKRSRLIIGALAGSVSSLLIFLPALPYLIMFAVKVFLAFLLILITFGTQKKPVFAKIYLTFFGVNFIFAGSMFALWTAVKPSGMYYENGTVYFDISAITLIISTIIAYFIIALISYILDKRIKSDEIYPIEIEVDNRQTIINGFVDTGNALTEAFSGLPVVICQFDAISEIIPKELHSIFKSHDISQLQGSTLYKWKKRMRVIPYNVVSGEGILLAFRPDRFYIVKGQKKVQKDVYIAVTFQKVSQGEFDTLLNNKIKV